MASLPEVHVTLLKLCHTRLNGMAGCVLHVVREVFCCDAVIMKVHVTPLNFVSPAS